MFRKGTQDRKVSRRATLNFLPLTGLAPGETIDIDLVGHTPSGIWEDKRVGFTFFQHGTDHIPSEDNCFQIQPRPIKNH